MGLRKNRRRRYTDKIFLRSFDVKKEKWCDGFSGKWEKEKFCSRMRDSREYLYISGNESAKRKKSIRWEKGICLQEHCPSGLVLFRRKAAHPL